jgi:hypothetical protein
MRKCLVLWAVLGLLVIFTCPANADSTYVLTFDDVAFPKDSILGTITDNYQGFEWDGFGVISEQGYKSQRYYKNDKISFPSSPVAVFNGQQGKGMPVVSLANSKPFLLEGAYFSTWDKNNKPINGQSADGLTVIGYLDGKEVGNTKFSLTPDFVWEAFNFGPVDLLTFNALGSNDNCLWLMDNVQIANNVQVSVVPLPTTLGMFCGGLLALYVFRRRAIVEKSLKDIVVDI